MLYIEIHINEDVAALRTQLADAYMAESKEVPPLFQMGEVIMWDGRQVVATNRVPIKGASFGVREFVSAMFAAPQGPGSSGFDER